MANQHAHTQLMTRGSAATFRRLVTGICIVAASFGTLACGSRQPEIAPVTVGADRLLFDRGSEAIENEDWIRAREYFVQLRDNYPQSALRSQARLGVADTYDGEGTAESYVVALEEYRDFLSLYPTDERADYAQYKVGMIYFRQMRRPERDQSETRSAIREFRLFQQRYPDSPLLGEVRAQLREAEDRLSLSNFEVGYFYYRNRWYPGAIDRFEAILSEDPGYTQRDAVYFHLAHSYQETGEEEKALTMFERLLEEFPETEFLEDVRQYMAALELAVDEEPAVANVDPEDAAQPDDQ